MLASSIARGPPSFAWATRVERYADLAREIVRRGHAIENHSQRHRHDFSLLGPQGMGAEIARAQDSIARVTGQHAAVFSRARRPAQSVSGSCADPTASAPCELDAARIRYRRSGSRRRCIGDWPTPLAGRRYPAAARRPCRAQPRRAAGDPGRAAARCSRRLSCNNSRPSPCAPPGRCRHEAAAAQRFTATSCIGTGVAPTLADAARRGAAA